MKANCLFTINIGNFVPVLVRDRMLVACDRWNCDYAEIHEQIPGTYASCSKFLGLERLSGYHKVMMLDGDCIISDKAPNPFTLLNQENVLLAVSDYMQAPNHCQAWLDGAYKLGMEEALADFPTLSKPPPELFFNGGFWLCINNEKARQMFRMAANLIRPGPVQMVRRGRKLPYTEMGCANLALHNTPGMKLCLLPETWNHIIPEGGQPSPDCYINHFGGWAQDLLRRLSFEYERTRIISR